MEFSDHILSYFQDHDIKPAQISAKIGVNKSTFTKWKNNPTSKIDLDIAFKISRYLNVSIDYLITGQECNSAVTTDEEGSGLILCNVELIRQLANTKGMSLSSLEQAVGLGNGTIGKWKKQSPSCDKLKLVADYLSVSLDYLMASKEPLCTDQLSDDKQKLLENYNQLTPWEQGRVFQFIADIIAAKQSLSENAVSADVSDTDKPTAAILDQKKHLA